MVNISIESYQTISGHTMNTNIDIITTYLHQYRKLLMHINSNKCCLLFENTQKLDFTYHDSNFYHYIFRITNKTKNNIINLNNVTL